MLSGPALVFVEGHRHCTNKSALATLACPSMLGPPAVVMFCSLGVPMTFVTCSLWPIFFKKKGFFGPSPHLGLGFFFVRPGAHLHSLCGLGAELVQREGCAESPFRSRGRGSLRSVSTSSCTPLRIRKGHTRCETPWTPSKNFGVVHQRAHQPHWRVKSFIRKLSFCSRLALNWQPWFPESGQRCRLRCALQTAPAPRSGVTDSTCGLANQMAAVRVHSTPFSLASEAGSVGISAWVVSTPVHFLLGLKQEACLAVVDCVSGSCMGIAGWRTDESQLSLLEQYLFTFVSIPSCFLCET